MVAIQAAKLSRGAVKMERGILAQAVLANDVPIELHGIINDCGQCPDFEVKVGDLAGIGFPSVVEGKV